MIEQSFRVEVVPGILDAEMESMVKGASGGQLAGQESLASFCPMVTCVVKLENAQQQEQEFRPVGAMGRGEQQAVLWSVCTRRAYH